MTPKFKYDPTSHCLREVIQKPDKTCYEHAQFNTPDKFREEIERRLASLRVIPCAPGELFPEGELVEGVHFKTFTGIGTEAYPITPRLYTQAEALEIWRAGYDCGHAEAAREDYIEKQQYFKTRFKVEL
jgi:hypothetical protein